MVKGFWGELKKPCFVLAPMEDVTDVAFRAMFARYSKSGGELSALWTEFTSADALSHPEGRGRVSHRLRFDAETEAPIVAQIFGARPENIEIASAHCASLGFQGIDLNMGCPEKNIQKQGACAALIKTPELAVETILAAQRGAGEIPVSVKTRIGYNTIDLEGWVGLLLAQDIPVLTVHLRTKKEMSDVPAHWELMREIVALRDRISPETLIIGNGDVNSMEEAYEKVEQTGCDGVMVGRGAFGKPWFFRRGYEPTISEKLRILVEHTELFENSFLTKPEGAPEGWYRDKNFAIMKKHFKAYANGFDGAGALRVKLMAAENAHDVRSAVENFLASSEDLGSTHES